MTSLPLSAVAIVIALISSWIIIVAGIVVAVLLAIVAVFLIRGGKKNAAGTPPSGTSDWQRQSQPSGDWNQQGGGWGQSAQQQQAGGWGQPAQQQPGGWGQPAQQQQAGGWGAQEAVAQQPANSWGGNQPSANSWGNQNPGAQNPWEQQQAAPAQDQWAQQPASGAQGWGSSPNQQPQSGFGNSSGSGPSWGQPAADAWNAQPQAGASPQGAGGGWQQQGNNNSWSGLQSGQQDITVFGGPNEGDRTIVRPMNAPSGGIGMVRVEEGKEPGRVYEVRKDSLSIGRSRESDIFLEDLAVSRLHASILNLGSGNYALKDEGSANGTKVNGQLVNKYQTYPLSEGDRIQLGQTVLVFGKR